MLLRLPRSPFILCVLQKDGRVRYSLVHAHERGASCPASLAQLLALVRITANVCSCVFYYNTFPDNFEDYSNAGPVETVQ